jgi:cobalamin biosynthesis Mg chelatase CobN
VRKFRKPQRGGDDRGPRVYDGPLHLRRSLLIATLLFLLAPAMAQAQDEPGVYADPDAPAGKEYAIPLEQARRESSGSEDHQQRRRSSSSSQAFGAGVTPEGTSDQSAGSESSTGSSPSSSSHEKRKKTRRRTAPRTQSIAPAAVRAASKTDDSAGIRIAGIVAAVMLVGGLLGLAARRVLRSS